MVRHTANVKLVRIPVGKGFHFVLSLPPLTLSVARLHLHFQTCLLLKWASPRQASPTTFSSRPLPGPESSAPRATRKNLKRAITSTTTNPKQKLEHKRDRRNSNELSARCCLKTYKDIQISKGTYEDI